jgi:hypothetical protein
VKLLALKGGLPGKDFFQFHIAPLDPALKGGACGEQTGQQPPAKPIKFAPAELVV